MTTKNQSPKETRPLDYHPRTDADRLALQIARGLGEEKRFPEYRIICENRSEEIIRKAYDRAINTPVEKIRKSRSALFFYLVNKYTHEKKD